MDRTTSKNYIPVRLFSEPFENPTTLPGPHN